MSYSYNTPAGTTFLYNEGLSGNVTILRGEEQVTVSAEELLEFVDTVRGNHGSPGKEAAQSA